MGFSRCHAMPGSPFATLSFLDMHNCPFLLCNFFQKGVAKNIVENKRVDGKVIQTVKANLGPVTEEQIPYLKVAYATKKPRLVYDDD